MKNYFVLGTRARSRSVPVCIYYLENDENLKSICYWFIRKKICFRPHNTCRRHCAAARALGVDVPRYTWYNRFR